MPDIDPEAIKDTKKFYDILYGVDEPDDPEEDGE